MANCLIAWPNRSDAGMLTGSPWSAALPVTNLQNRFLTNYARTTGVSLFTPSPAIPDNSQCSAVINVNFGQGRYVTACALLRHNLSLSAQARLVLWTDATMTIPIYDSLWQPIWPRYFDTASLRWNDSNFLFGRLSLDDFGMLPAIWLQMVQDQNNGCIQPFSAQYASLYIQDQYNAAGFIQIGRLYMAEDWTPVRNMSYGETSLGVTDPTTVDTALDGTEYYELRGKYREAVFTLKYMGNVEGVTQALRMTQNRGVSGDVLYVFDPGNVQLLQQRSFVGRLEKLSPLVYAQYGITSMAFQIKELI